MADIQHLIIQKDVVDSTPALDPEGDSKATTTEPEEEQQPQPQQQQQSTITATTNELTQKDLNDNDDTTNTTNYELIPKDAVPPSPVSTSSVPSPTNTTKRRMSSISSDKSTTNNTKQKKSRKLQGVGVKKPLYTRYESLFIVKAYKTISEKHPNLVLTDVFKIVSILFKDEAKRQGFKERTPDQLYQKYKRIQHGLNHGEVEFLEFFKQNQYNPREWIPDFSSVQDISIIDRIVFPKLDEAVNDVKWSGNSNGVLKPENNYETPTRESMDEDEQEEDDELLTLAGYEDNSIECLKLKIESLEGSLRLHEEEILLLKQSNDHKDQEIEFLKNMVKEDLSYIRHKLNDNKNV